MIELKPKSFLIVSTLSCASGVPSSNYLIQLRVRTYTNNMISPKNCVTKTHVKSDNLMLDILMFLIFEKQNVVKLIESCNYKNTSFVHVNFLRRYNWVFWKKHTPIFFLPTDLISYDNRMNSLLTTDLFLQTQSILLFNFVSITYNSNAFVVASPESGIYSISSIWSALSFYEREASEMFGIHFFKKNDTRNLLLDYSNSSTPMRKDFSIYGNLDLRYTKFFEGPRSVFTYVTEI